MTESIIGKNVIESLTTGMYENPLFVYREYIQNAADAVDHAVKSGILQKGEEAISVRIDNERQEIIIEDNAIGIESAKAFSILRNIAKSTKQKGIDKGFRGIRRLGGLAYCQKLTFETSCKGEDVKSIVTWDAEKLQNLINDTEDKSSGEEVVKEVTSFDSKKEDKDEHYFKVVMEDVNLGDLLNIDEVTNYLQMVAPIDINSSFLYKKEIQKYMNEHQLSVDTYNIYINGDQIFKPYNSKIYSFDKAGNKKTAGNVYQVNYFNRKSASGEPLFWGWFSMTSLEGQIPSANLARGIRLRSANIQIGDSEICKKFFTSTSDQRFSFYFFGELHALNSKLIPNSRRDYFEDNDICKEFENAVKEEFLKLKKYCYEVSNLKSCYKKISSTEKIRKEIEEKDKKGFTNKEEQEELYKKFEEQKERDKKTIKELDAQLAKIKVSGSPVASLVDRIKENYNLGTTSAQSSSPAPFPKPEPLPASSKPKFRTDGKAYSKMSKAERKLVGKIYSVISKVFPDEGMRNSLIDKIEEEITK